jgi:SAM-dependent methyltransferase
MSSHQPGVMTKAFWSDVGGETWVGVQALMDRLNQGVTDAVIEAAFPRPGATVLDIGCGGGATTRAMARRLGPQGRAVGVDVSSALIAAAQASVDGEAVDFLLGDAQTYPFETAMFDAVMSRYGVMFFEDSVAAFANLRHATRPDGRLAFACWRAAADNPLAQAALQTAAPLLSQPPPPPPAPDAPGRFAFADPERVRGILDQSGWRDIAIERLDAPSPLSVDELMSISINLGTLGPLLRAETPAVRDRVQQAVRARLETHAVDGIVPMASACWLVTARA